MSMTSRPAAGEYAAALADYVASIREDEDVQAVLAGQLDQVQARLVSVPKSRGDYRYAPGKWTLKDVVGHLSDTERVFAYRALSIARGDTIPLPSFDDQAWVVEVGAEDRTLADMVDEWSHVRRATLDLFWHLPPAAWSRRGTANNEPTSVCALAYVIAGHTRHHLEVVESRYLP
jgi:hypothetical protein